MEKKIQNMEEIQETKKKETKKEIKEMEEEMQEVKAEHAANQALGLALGCWKSGMLTEDAQGSVAAHFAHSGQAT